MSRIGTTAQRQSQRGSVQASAAMYIVSLFLIEDGGM
jgi:hypothetical protein